MFDEFKKEFTDGIRGKNRSVFLPAGPKSTNNSRLGRRIGINAGTYILLGAGSGCGKTSYVDSQFVMYPYLQGENIRWIYRSMERPTTHKIGKWICFLLYLNHGLDIDLPTMFQWYNKKYSMTPEIEKMILDTEPEISKFLERVTFVPGQATPEDIFEFSKKIMMQHGRFIRTDGTNVYINEKLYKPLELINGKMGFAHKDFIVYENSMKYLPKDNTIFMQVNDHIGKISGSDEKETIKKHSNNMAVLSDIFRMVVIDVTQFNRKQQGTDRKTKEPVDVREEDFRMSSVPYHNASLVLGLLNPYKLGYDYVDCVAKKTSDYVMKDSYENRLRILKVVKNTNGAEDFFIPLYLMGENGGYAELTPGEDKTPPVLELKKYWDL